MVLLIVSCTTLNAQQDSAYFIKDEQLVHGTSVLLNIPKNDCYLNSINEYKLIVGKQFVIIRIRDEMENHRGVIIFDKKNGLVNFDTVQTERKKYYKSYECCVYVQELNGLLYFWDYIIPDGDYDCYYDSQTDNSMSLIPRYYIFEPESGNVETKTLVNKCKMLIEDEKIMCE